MNAVLWMVGLIGVVWGYSQFWMKWTSGKVGLSMQIEHDQPLTAGDEVGVWMILENRSWLVIPWLELSQELPDGLLVQSGDEWKTEIKYRTYLLPRQRVKRLVYIRCVTRGLHRFHRAEVTFGDGTGLQNAQEMLETSAHLLVRPRLLDKVNLPVRLQELAGEQSVVRWYQEDPSRLVGIRSYMLGDPYKHIHWAATARTGELMVKQFDTTSDTTLYVVMNMQFFEPHWLGSIKEIVEYECSLAATLFDQASQLGITYGLSTNASWSDGGGQLNVPPDGTPVHFQTMLAALGNLWPRTVCSFADLLDQLNARLRNRASIVVLTAHWNDEAALALEHLAEGGHYITVVAFNEASRQIRHVSPPIEVIPIEVEADRREEAESA